MDTTLSRRDGIEACYEEPDPTTSAHNLWIAVLEQALIDLKSTEDEVCRNKASRWFTSKRKGIGSFLWICNDIINKNPKEVLNALKIYLL